MGGIFEAYRELEYSFAKFQGTSFAVSCNSGTSALHLALRALNIGPGDEVIVPEFTMIACAWAVSYCGATPVFVDCGADLLIDVSKIEAAITSRTRAIMPVHIYGRVCDMPRILGIAQSHGLKVVEDCAEAHGATLDDKKAGTFGDIGCFSFYRNKIIRAEEGGICVTENQALADRMRFLKNMAFNEGHDYIHPEMGFNYRMPDAQANLALESLNRIESNLEHRRKIAGLYDEVLKPFTIPRPTGSVIWVYDFIVPWREEVIRAIPKARRFFRPMSEQPMYYDSDFNKTKAHLFSEQGVYLPVDIEEEEANLYLAVLDELVHRYG